MNHIVKKGQEAVSISPKENVGLWLNPCDLNILYFSSWGERSNGLLCHTFLVTYLVVFDVIEMLGVPYRVDSSRVKER